MTKEEFIKLFELEKVYKKYQSRIPFCLGFHDNLTRTENTIFYFFKKNKISIMVEYNDLNNNNKLEIHLKFSEDKIELNNNELFINEIFPFLTFDNNLESALKFIADFINKILIPKYNLMGSVTTY